MITRSDTFDLVVKAIESTMDTTFTDVTSETALFDELGLDSTGVLDLLMRLEDDLGVEIDTDTLDFADFATVGSLVKYVQPLRAN
jgi:acyl carrier protein